MLVTHLKRGSILWVFGDDQRVAFSKIAFYGRQSLLARYLQAFVQIHRLASENLRDWIYG